MFFHIEKSKEIEDNKEKAVEVVEALVGYVRHGATNAAHVIKDGSCEIVIDKFYSLYQTFIGKIISKAAKSLPSPKSNY